MEGFWDDFLASYEWPPVSAELKRMDPTGFVAASHVCSFVRSVVRSVVRSFGRSVVRLRQQTPVMSDACVAANGMHHRYHQTAAFGIGGVASGVPFHTHGGGWSEVIHGAKHW